MIASPSRKPRGGAFAVALSIVWAASAHAQSQSLQFGGQVDLAGTVGRDALYENWFKYGDSNFDPYNLRLSASGEPTPGIEAFAQVSLTEAAGAWVEGAYFLWTPPGGRDLHLEAGKIPWAIGTWAPRSYADKNWLVGLPLMHQYHTSLREDAIPPSADALLAAAGSGQTGPDYGSGPGERGMPVVYDRVWDFGVVASGSFRPMEFAVGAVNGTPGAPSPGPDENNGKAFLGRLGFMPWPEVRLGVSGAYGPYLPEEVESALPPGAHLDDFHQRLGMADVELRRGHLEARGEAYLNVWETPTVGDLRMGGGYVESRATVHPSLYVAGRYEVMRFGRLAGATISGRPWDNDRDRWEAGLGYRVARRALLKGVYQSNVEHPTGEDAEREKLYALQFTLGF